MVLPQGDQRVGVALPVVPSGRHEPSGPADQVHGESGEDEQHERDGTLAERGGSRPQDHSGAAPRQRIGDDDVEAETREHVQARPFHGRGRPERQPCGDEPGATPEHRPPERVGTLGVSPLEHGDRPLPVDDHEEHAQQDEEGQDAVEQGDAAHHDAQTVDREQRPRHARDDDRAAEAAGDQVDQQHRCGAEHRGGEAPSRAVVGSADRHAERDEPLAERGVHDERALLGQRQLLQRDERIVGVLAPGALVAQGPQRPGVFDVVGLVEGELVRVGDVDQAQERGDRGDDERREPADRATPVGIQQQTIAELPVARRPLGGSGEQWFGRGHRSSLDNVPSRSAASRPPKLGG